MKFPYFSKRNWVSRFTGKKTETRDFSRYISLYKRYFDKLAERFSKNNLISRPILVKDLTLILNEINMTRETFNKMKLATTTIGFCVGMFVLISSLQGLFSVWLLFVVIFTSIGFIMPDLYVKDRRESRNDELEREFPYFIDLLYLYTGSAAFDNIGDAIIQVSFHIHGIIGEDLRRLAALYSFVDRETFLNKLDEKFSNPTAKDLISTLRLTLKYGGNINEKIGILAREAHKGRIQKAKELGQRFSVVLMIPLMFFHFPVAVALLLAPTILTIQRTLGL